MGAAPSHSSPCEAVVRELGVHHLCAQSAKPLRPVIQGGDGTAAQPDETGEGHVGCIVSFSSSFPFSFSAALLSKTPLYMQLHLPHPSGWQ